MKQLNHNIVCVQDEATDASRMENAPCHNIYYQVQCYDDDVNGPVRDLTASTAEKLRDKDSERERYGLDSCCWRCKKLLHVEVK